MHEAMRYHVNYLARGKIKQAANKAKERTSGESRSYCCPEHRCWEKQYYHCVTVGSLPITLTAVDAPERKIHA